MFFLSRKQKAEKTAKKHIDKNRKALESLRAYDKGEKEISTDKLTRRISSLLKAR
ncbi:MAG: hypothetical protein R3B52_00040 [Candidatus Paceibacterota bacterium]